jgi:GNAT superfamily N-acetyltransferase
MAEITVRTAGPDTVDALVASVTELFREDAGQHDRHRDITWPSREGAAHYRGQLDEPACLLALAWQGDAGGDRPVGHLVGKLIGPDTMLLHRIAVLESVRVDPAVRGNGVGGQLVAEFFDWARRNDAVATSVTAYAANTAAQSFYQRHGFIPQSLTLRAPVPA